MSFFGRRVTLYNGLAKIKWMEESIGNNDTKYLHQIMLLYSEVSVHLIEKWRYFASPKA